MAMRHFLQRSDEQVLINWTIHIYSHADIVGRTVGRTHLIHPDPHLHRCERLRAGYTITGVGSGYV